MVFALGLVAWAWASYIFQGESESGQLCHGVCGQSCHLAPPAKARRMCHCFFRIAEQADASGFDRLCSAEHFAGVMHDSHTSSDPLSLFLLDKFSLLEKFPHCSYTKFFTICRGPSAP